MKASVEVDTAAMPLRQALDGERVAEVVRPMRPVAGFNPVRRNRRQSAVWAVPTGSARRFPPTKKRSDHQTLPARARRAIRYCFSSTKSDR